MNMRIIIMCVGISLILTMGCAQKADTTAANKKVVLDSFAAMDRQDYARCRELWPEGDSSHKYIRLVGSPDMNREELIAFLQTYWKAFPDTKHVIHDMIAEGDLVVARVTCEGTQRGDFEGMPASGNQVKYSGVHVVRFANGKIQDWWVLDDNLSMLRQLGMELKPK
jgi:steroid delta-isomerase-like uncharacterized protein